MRQKINLRVRKLLLNKWFYYISAFLAIVYAMVYMSIPRTSIYNGDENTLDGILTNYTISGDKLSFLMSSKEDLKCTYYFKSENEKAVKTHVHKSRGG